MHLSLSLYHFGPKTSTLLVDFNGQMEDIKIRKKGRDETFD